MSEIPFIVPRSQKLSVGRGVNGIQRAKHMHALCWKDGKDDSSCTLCERKLGAHYDGVPQYSGSIPQGTPLLRCTVYFVNAIQATTFAGKVLEDHERNIAEVTQCGHDGVRRDFVLPRHYDGDMYPSPTGSWSIVFRRNFDCSIILRCPLKIRNWKRQQKVSSHKESSPASLMQNISTRAW